MIIRILLYVVLVLILLSYLFFSFVSEVLIFIACILFISYFFLVDE
jgi:hypothetical protein